MYYKYYMRKLQVLEEAAGFRGSYSSISLSSQNSIYFHNSSLRKLQAEAAGSKSPLLAVYAVYESFKILQIQKNIFSVETIGGNTINVILL